MTPIPQHLIDRGKLLAGVHGVVVAAEILGVSDDSLYRAKRRGWRQATYESKLRPIPGDFAIIARKMTQRELAKHYGAGIVAVRRWLKEKPRPNFKPGVGRRQYGEPTGPTNIGSMSISSSATPKAEGRARFRQGFHRLKIAFPVGRGA